MVSAYNIKIHVDIDAGTGKCYIFYLHIGGIVLSSFFLFLKNCLNFFFLLFIKQLIVLPLRFMY